MQNGVDPNVRSQNWKTPLHILLEIKDATLLGGMDSSRMRSEKDETRLTLFGEKRIDKDIEEIVTLLLDGGPTFRQRMMKGGRRSIALVQTLVWRSYSHCSIKELI